MIIKEFERWNPTPVGTSLLAALCLSGCSSSSVSKDSDIKKYEFTRVVLPEGIDRIEDMLFAGDTIFVAAVTAGKKNSKAVRLYRGKAHGVDWEQVFEKKYPDRQESKGGGQRLWARSR